MDDDRKTNNASYDLACEYVREEIRDIFGGEWEEVFPCAMVEVGSMQDCDCIPIYIYDLPLGPWRLRRVKRRGRDVIASYEATRH